MAYPRDATYYYLVALNAREMYYKLFFPQLHSHIH
jgi:hypothetical protein